MKGPGFGGVDSQAGPRKSGGCGEERRVTVCAAGN